MLYDPKWELPIETKPLEPWQGVLRSAAELIRRRGHCQNRYEASDGSLCVIGAVSTAATGAALPPLFGAPDDVYNKAISAIVEHMSMWSIPEWNDRPGRTPNEVATMLDEVASH
jgi:hypothetical protein